MLCSSLCPFLLHRIVPALLVLSPSSSLKIAFADAVRSPVKIRGRPRWRTIWGPRGWGIPIEDLASPSQLYQSMDRQNGDDHELVSVVGFEVPRSPESSYNNPLPGNEDEAREPPPVPPHLNHTLLNYQPPSPDDPTTLSVPQNVILNHLYIENREGPRSVVAMGITHRFRSKFVTVVLYKPVQRR